MLFKTKTISRYAMISILNSAPSPPGVAGTQHPFHVLFYDGFRHEQSDPGALSGPLVVKYGSKILSRIFSAIPPALSVMVTTALSSSRNSLIWTLCSATVRSMNASRAFIKMLRST